MARITVTLNKKVKVDGKSMWEVKMDGRSVTFFTTKSAANERANYLKSKYK